MTMELEKRYGFAAQLATLSDAQLVERFNAQAGNRGWGQARMYFTHCLRTELDRRSFDASCIASREGLRINRKAMIKDGEITIQKQQPDEEKES